MDNPTEFDSPRIVIVGMGTIGLSQQAYHRYSLLRDLDYVTHCFEQVKLDAVELDEIRFALDECIQVSVEDFLRLSEQIAKAKSDIENFAGVLSRYAAPKYCETDPAPPKSRRRNRGRNKALDRVICKEAYCQRR